MKCRPKSKHSIGYLKCDSLRTPIKRQRLLNLKKFHDPSICCLQETHFECNNYKLKESEKR